MTNDLKLSAEHRTELGSTACRRLRRGHRIPGNVYGHGEDPQPISVPAEAVMAVIHSGHKVVDLSFGSNSEKALVREVQWDTFGNDVLHVDLQRVSEGERVETEVPVETHGTAPGVVEGGILERPLHTISVECPALRIPEKFELNINGMTIGQSIHIRDLAVPEGVTILNDEDEVVLQISEPSAVPDEVLDAEQAADAGETPEVVSEDKATSAGAGE